MLRPPAKQKMGASASRVTADSSSDNADHQLLRLTASKFHQKCRGCKQKLPLADFDAHIETWLDGAQQIPPASPVSSYTCTGCFVTTCVGCGYEPTLGEVNIFTSVGVVNRCCFEGQLFGIWLLLSNFDDEERKKVPKSKMKLPKSPLKSLDNGVGFAGGYEYHSFDFSSPKKYDMFVAREEVSPDVFITTTIKLLTAFIQSLELSTTVQKKASQVRCMFHFSSLFDQVASLIRNDSISEILERRDLYYAAFAFIKGILDHVDLAKLIFQKRLDKKSSPGLRALSLQHKSSFICIDHSSPLASLFSYGGNIYTQAQTYIQLLEKDPAGFSTQTKESTKICKLFITLYEQMRTKQSENLSFSLESDNRDLWAKFSEEHRITFNDDVLKDHRFKSHFNSAKSSGQKGRLSTIGKEIANMRTSLPPGIFVKVADSRSDVMKILIIGPEGSPYTGGLFTFDLFLDAQYPASPPMVQFTLDGNDSEQWSFNPNLHRGGGQVCLSIINTWQGAENEKWQPGKTTILSVLISVQAMILGAPIPWINEPGFQGQVATPEAIQHKLLIEYKTVRYAMIGWLEDASWQQQGIWDDIVKVYWENNGIDVLSTVREWATSNRQLGPKDDTPKKISRKKKSTVLEMAPEGLLENLESLLDLRVSPKVENPLVEAIPIAGKSGIMGKRKHTVSDNAEKEPRFDADEPESKAKRQKQDSSDVKIKQEATGDVTQMWEYTGSKTQKETRAALKDFGLGAAATIGACVVKLERHINNRMNKGKLDEQLMEKWGNLTYIEEDE